MLQLNHYQNSYFRHLGSFLKSIGLFIIFSSWLALAACGAGNDKDETQTSEDSQEPEIKVEETSNNQIVAEVFTNKDKWLSHGIKQYQIEMQKICFCAPDAVRLMIFSISDNEIKDVRYADSGDEVDPSYYNQFNTIEGMFDLVAQALDKNPANIVISYDEEYGYIKELTVDYQQNIADDEFTIIASNMKPSQ